jgi:DNA-binding XRE family transcriptional regulator
MKHDNPHIEKSTHTKHAPISHRQYLAILDRLDDLSDTLAAMQAEARGKPSDDALPIEFTRRLINGESPLLVWREYRGFTQVELAKRAKLKGHSYIVAIEKRQKPGSIGTMKALAKALGCALDDLVD